MNETSVTLRVHSPRWGSDDAYQLELKRESLVIRAGHSPATTTCTYRERLDPEWTGADLIATLANDRVYAPAILPRLLQYAWLSWRKNELDNEAVQVELEAVADWLNSISRSMPDTEFWHKFF